MRELEKIDSVEERIHHAVAEQFDLPREEQVPHVMVFVGEGFPALRDDIILPPAKRLVPADRLLKHLIFLFPDNKKPAELGAGGWRLVDSRSGARQLDPASQR